MAIVLSSYDSYVNSKITVNPNLSSGQVCKMSYSPPNSSNWYWLWNYESDSTISASKDFTIPVSWLRYFTTTDSAIFQIRGDLYNGSTYVSSSYANITIRARDEDAPTYTLTVSEGNGEVISKGLNMFIQNKSQLIIAFENISLCYDSPLHSAYVVIKDNQGETLWDSFRFLTDTGTGIKGVQFTTPVLTKAGTYNIYVDLFDQRNGSLEKSTTYTSVEYSPPKITNVSSVRSWSNGSESEDGTYLKYIFQASISALNNKNTRKFEIGYKRNDLSGSYTFKDVTGTSYSINQNTVLSGVTLSANYVWDICFRATDIFGSTIVERTLGTDFKLMNFNASGKSIALGTISNRSSNETYLDSNLTINCLKGLEINHVDIDTYINEKLQKNMAVAYFTNANIKLGSDYTDTPFNNSYIVGNKLSLSGGGIKIGAGVNRIKISATAFFENIDTVDYIWLLIRYNGSTNLTTSIQSSSKYFASASITDDIIRVKEGDIISIGFSVQGGATSYVRGGKDNTRLYVEVID